MNFACLEIHFFAHQEHKTQKKVVQRHCTYVFKLTHSVNSSNKKNDIQKNFNRTYLSIITGSDGVSFRLPQLFLSQQRLKNKQDEFNKNKKE